MSYRKITVDGTVYEYTIGKTHTKIKGLSVFKNADIGSPVHDSDTIVITPKHVAKAIKGDTSPNPILMVNEAVLKETGKVTYIPFSLSDAINDSLTKYVICFHDPDDYYDVVIFTTIESTLTKEEIIEKINSHNEHYDHVERLKRDVYVEYYPYTNKNRGDGKDLKEKLALFIKKHEEVETNNPVCTEFVRGKIDGKLKVFYVLTLEEWFKERLNED